jgi:hypothetical protein
MSKTRASIFEEDELDLSGFAPKAIPDIKAPPAAEVRAVAEAANFRSREAKVTVPKPAAKREPRRYRTGRNVQLSLKTTQSAIDLFYAIADQQGWVLGETFDRAMKSLQQQLKKARTPEAVN